MSTTKGNKYKDVLKDTISFTNYKEVRSYFGPLTSFSLEEYNYKSSYHALNKKKIKELFGPQDITVNFSYRNWIWIFEDGPLFDGITEDVLIFMFWSEQGVCFEVAKKPPNVVRYNDVETGVACAKFLENLAVYLKDKNVHL